MDLHAVDRLVAAEPRYLLVGRAAQHRLPLPRFAALRKDGSADIGQRRSILQGHGQPPHLAFQLVERLDQQQLPLAEDGHDVGHPLHLADLMARQEDGLALRGPVHHALQKLAPHQGVEARRGLVENQQLRLMGQRQREHHLGVHSLGERFEFLLRGQPELGRQPRILGQIPAGIEAGREPADLLDRHPVVQGGGSAT